MFPNTIIFESEANEIMHCKINEFSGIKKNLSLDRVKFITQLIQFPLPSPMSVYVCVWCVEKRPIRAKRPTEEMAILTDDFCFVFVRDVRNW
jgi:hypothetical protein